MNTLGANIYYNFTPLPKDVTGWNYSHVIFKQLIEQTNPKVIIEVGTWKGGSAIKMGNYLKQSNRQAKIYCVDTWLGALEFWTRFKDSEERNLMLKNGYPQVYYQFLSNVVHNDLQDIIIPVPMPSTMGAAVLKDYGVTAELIYVDGSHEYEDVKADIKAYKELCTGIIFGDDYGWPSVKDAVRDSGLNVNIVDENYWIYKI